MALSLVEHLGAKKLRALIAHIGTPDAILQADAARLREVKGIGAVISTAIRAIDLAAIEAAIKAWQTLGVHPIPLYSPDYPTRLQRVEDAPPTLFVRGECAMSPRAAAIVGTRTPSPGALEAANRLAFELAARGVTVVSGLAYGIDGAAHRGALSCMMGETIAVLGGGVLRVYPPAHRELAGMITANGWGALVSETHPLADVKPTTLVARNRLISGLSGAVIIIETAIDGGAMHAARRAVEQGRHLYALESSATGNRALLDAGDAAPLMLDANAIDALAATLEA